MVKNPGGQLGAVVVTFPGGSFVAFIDASRCFIATATYGDENAPEVRTLRRWRDECLAGNPLGRQFVRAYYALSPPLAEAVADSPAGRAMVRAALAPVVGAVKIWLEAPWLYGLAGALLLMRLLRRSSRPRLALTETLSKR